MSDDFPLTNVRRQKYGGEISPTIRRRKYSDAPLYSTSRKSYLGEHLSTNQNIEVSIIIPSFNRYPLNLFSLYSLENQTFDPSKMEVIFIDDASTDQTHEKLNNYKPPFHFKYIRNERNLGRAKVRNLGVEHASGNILIFLDAEMITEPDFVKNHYQCHQSNKNVIVTGVMHLKNVITSIFPNTKNSKLKEVSSLIQGNSVFSKRFENFKQSSELPYPLIDKKDIMNQTYKQLIIKRRPWFRQITRNFDERLTGFQFPWMAFLTGNVSVSKETIVKAGLFDESFIKYGYEDWELGYRLFQQGAQFLIKDNVVTYHQMHPVGGSNWNEAIGNFHLFISKHHDVDVLMLGLELARLTDLLTMNEALFEYKRLMKEYSNQLHSFQEKFITILETIALLLLIDIRHFNILGAAGYGTDEKTELLKDIDEIKELGNYTTLTNVLMKIINS